MSRLMDQLTGLRSPPNERRTETHVSDGPPNPPTPSLDNMVVLVSSTIESYMGTMGTSCSFQAEERYSIGIDTRAI